jgi:hypothetical protein
VVLLATAKIRKLPAPPKVKGKPNPLPKPKDKHIKKK